jgi:hypothetical protein
MTHNIIYPYYISAINHSCGYNHMWSTRRPFSKYLNVRVDFRTANTVVAIVEFAIMTLTHLNIASELGISGSCLKSYLLRRLRSGGSWFQASLGK